MHIWDVSMYGGINIMKLGDMWLEEFAVFRALGPPTCLVENELPGMEMRQGFSWGRENQENDGTEDCFKEGVFQKKSVFSKVNCYWQRE